VLALREKVKSAIRGCLRSTGAAGGLSLCLCAPLALAEEANPRTEYLTGFEASDNYASGYVGAGYALSKAGYDAPGFRLRAIGASGRYDYQGSLLIDDVSVPTTFDGQVSFAAALLGYEFRPGGVIVKLFAGVEGEDQRIAPRDPDNSVQGTELGLILQAELWRDLSERSFLSFDASYGTAFQEYWSLLRLGWRLTPRLALGLEGGALGNEEYDAGRGGGLARVNLRAMEITLSGGFTGNYLEDQPSGYVALGVYRKF
jgi:Cellulose biosynthesis protein BcsS